MRSGYISTTKMATENGLSTSDMFEKLIQIGFIKVADGPKKWELTEDGKNVGGQYSENSGFRDYIEWPVDLFSKVFKNENIAPTLLKPRNSTNSKSADTEGEKYIKEFFREVGIKYEHQKTIRGLSNDPKKHRVADFYLPKYDVYVEFFGNWNTNDEFKENYKIKKNVYKCNNIPCVYLYPENLGSIHFLFDYRLIETLNENYKEKELRRYKTWKLMQGAGVNIIGAVICILVLILMFIIKEQGKLVMYLLISYNLFRIAEIWYYIFVKGSYSIARMLKE